MLYTIYIQYTSILLLLSFHLSVILINNYINKKVEISLQSRQGAECDVGLDFVGF